MLDPAIESNHNGCDVMLLKIQDLSRSTMQPIARASAENNQRAFALHAY
jgi:hypothetical protein